MQYGITKRKKIIIINPIINLLINEVRLERKLVRQHLTGKTEMSGKNKK